ncbi:MAG: hypothetical protein AB1641_09475 [Thermodesulfobacteriota bacterium]
MNLLELKQEKRFLGLEFLTWVWYQSEINSGLLNVPGHGPVEIWFEDKMVLESGSGDARQTVTCQGRNLDLVEARTALREGKKVSQARLRLAYESREWRVTVKAEGLELTGIKPPPTLDPSEEEPDGLMGRMLERLAGLRELTGLLDCLFKQFLALRLTGDWNGKELPRLRKWLKEQ